MAWVNRVRVIERSQERVLVDETAASSTGAAVLLLGLLAALASFNASSRGQILGSMVYLLIFGGLGLWMLVESDFSIEQESQLFQVRRRLWFVRWSWSYPLGQVKRVEVFKAKDGDGLRLVLILGRKIRLTMSASWERESMYQGQAALEYAIRKYGV